MPNVCSGYRVKGCPASFYMSCPAYLSGKNCWEVKDKHCCDTQNPSKCSACVVHSRARAAMVGSETNNVCVEGIRSQDVGVASD